jgi:hypothetical protein
MEARRESCGGTACKSFPPHQMAPRGLARAQPMQPMHPRGVPRSSCGHKCLRHTVGEGKRRVRQTGATAHLLIRDTGSRCSTSRTARVHVAAAQRRRRGRRGSPVGADSRALFPSFANSARLQSPIPGGNPLSARRRDWRCALRPLHPRAAWDFNALRRAHRHPGGEVAFHRRCRHHRRSGCARCRVLPSADVSRAAAVPPRVPRGV